MEATDRFETSTTFYQTKRHTTQKTVIFTNEICYRIQIDSLQRDVTLWNVRAKNVEVGKNTYYIL